MMNATSQSSGPTNATTIRVWARRDRERREPRRRLAHLRMFYSAGRDQGAAAGSTRTTSVSAWRSWKPRWLSRVTMPSNPSPNGMIATTRPTSRRRATRGPEDVRALVLDPDRQEAHPRRLAGQRPEREQVEAAEEHPGGGADHPAGGREAVAAEQRGEHGAASRKTPFRIAPSIRKAIPRVTRPTESVGAVRGLPITRRTKRSRPPSKRSAIRRIWRPMSPIRPRPGRRSRRGPRAPRRSARPASGPPRRPAAGPRRG